MRIIKLIIGLLFFCSLRTIAQDSKLYITFDVYGCSSCLQTASLLNGYPDLLSKASFLFSSDVTKLQAENLIEETLQLKGKAEVNDFVYDQYTSLYPKALSRKSPKVILYDKGNRKIVSVFSLDSIGLYQSKVNHFQSFGRLKYLASTHQIKSIKKLIGYKVLNCKNGNLVVNTYQNPHKLFIYNTSIKKLDSLVIDTNLEKRILHMNNVNTEHFSKEIIWHRESGFPHFSSFITNQILTDSTLSGVIVTRFYNHLSKDTVLLPTQIFQFFNYNIYLKELKLYSFEALWSGDSISDGPIRSNEEFYQEFDYPFIDEAGNWNTFINFQPIDSFSKTKMLVNYSYNPSAKLYSIDSIKRVIKFDSIVTFTGDKFNDPSFYFDYKLKGNYFYYNNAPLIRNIITNATINMSAFVNDLSWIDDVLPTNDGVFYVLVKAKQGRYLLLIDEQTNVVLAKREFVELNNALTLKNNITPQAAKSKSKNVTIVDPKTRRIETSKNTTVIKSNLVLGDDLSIYFIDNEGAIRQFSAAKL